MRLSYFCGYSVDVVIVCGVVGASDVETGETYSLSILIMILVVLSLYDPPSLHVCGQDYLIVIKYH